MSGTRQRLTADNTVQIIREWDQKSYDDFASEFGVSTNTIRTMVAAIRKEDHTMCPKKSRKNRSDTVKKAIEIIKAEQADTITE
jgi:transposase